MMDIGGAQADESLQDGVSIDALLALVGVLAAVGWGLTQGLAYAPSLPQATLGIGVGTAIVGYWVLATIAVVAVAGVAGAGVVRYSPLAWLWTGVVGLGLALDVALLAGFLPGGSARALLWVLWVVVPLVGFAVTGLVATHRNRAAYLVGGVAAGLVLLAGALFPDTIGSWAFAATGVVTAVPLLVDAKTGESAADAAERSAYEFRDVERTRSTDGGSEK